MSIELIAAVANYSIIGHQGKMPWGRIKIDLVHFKKITDGQVVVMGYKTLVSIGKELPMRKVLVLTHHPEKLRSFPWCKGTTVPAVLEMAKTKRVIIAGGQEVYQQFLPYATVAYITRIQKTFEGDVRFPDLPPREWFCSEYSSFYPPNSETPCPVRFEIWHRRETA